jgi:hypothetical protein
VARGALVGAYSVIGQMMGDGAMELLSLDLDPGDPL